MRRYFPAQPQTAKPVAKETDSICPTGGWIGPNGEKANGPVEARSLPFLAVIGGGHPYDCITFLTAPP